jgi:hypothetical protein
LLRLYLRLIPASKKASPHPAPEVIEAADLKRAQSYTVMPGQACGTCKKKDLALLGDSDLIAYCMPCTDEYQAAYAPPEVRFV